MKGKFLRASRPRSDNTRPRRFAPLPLIEEKFKIHSPHWRGLEIIPYLGSHAVGELALGERLRGVLTPFFWTQFPNISPT